MKIKVLLNPYSNRWNSRKRWPEAEQALRAAGVDFDLSISERPDHLVNLAAAAVDQGYRTVVVTGGDGSIGEVINGLARGWNGKGKFPATLGVIPTGSANDLADNVGLPRDFSAAARLIASGHTRAIDLCKCNERFFLNNSAAGLEPYITLKQEQITWIKGVPRYLVAAIQGILDKPEWGARLEWDDGSYQGRLSLITVGNGARTGGIFYMSPHANPFDGKLTFAYGHRATRLGLLQALPRAMKAGEGSFVEMEGMYEVHCTRLSVHLDRPSPVHTDGELFDRWLTDLEYGIYPGAVQILSD